MFLKHYSGCCRARWGNVTPYYAAGYLYYLNTAPYPYHNTPLKNVPFLPLQCSKKLFVYDGLISQLEKEHRDYMLSTGEDVSMRKGLDEFRLENIYEYNFLLETKSYLHVGCSEILSM